jgi:transposase
LFKIVFPVCCGIDVHKDFVVATIASTDSRRVTSYQTRKFKTMRYDLENLLKWLIEQECEHICMESTGKFWIPIFNVLEPYCRVMLANPRYVRNIPGKKTDQNDSVWLADLHKHGLVRSSFIPPKPVRELRDLVRYRCKLTNVRSSEKNRFQNSLTVSNIMLASVVSDIFGKSSQAIIAELLKTRNGSEVDFEPLLKRKLKEKSDLIAQSLQGTVSPEQAQKLKVCLGHHDAVNACLAQLDVAIAEAARPFAEAIALIATVPGVQSASATAIIAEIGPDMSVFPSSKHLCSWAGLTPQNNESAGKKKSVRVSRAGAYLKPLLIQCALASLREGECPAFRSRYERIKRRRGHKRALIAVARMMLTAIYHILLKNEPFDRSRDLAEARPVKADPVQAVVFSIEQAIALLTANGFQVSGLEAPVSCATT